MREATVYGCMPAQTPEPLPDRDGEPHKVPVEPPPEPPDPNPVRMRGSEAGRGRNQQFGRR